MKRTDFLLGRAATQKAYEEGEPFIVSAYMFDGYGKPNMRYTDPVKHPPKSRAKISYRIRVIPKKATV